MIKPPLVFLDANVKRIGILNRSIPSNNSAGLDKIDKILSIEGEKLDREGAEQALIALKTSLLQNPRFNQVDILITVLNENTGGGIFPASLSWDQIDDLCKKII